MTENLVAGNLVDPYAAGELGDVTAAAGETFVSGVPAEHYDDVARMDGEPLLGRFVNADVANAGAVNAGVVQNAAVVQNIGVGGGVALGPADAIELLDGRVVTGQGAVRYPDGTIRLADGEVVHAVVDTSGARHRVIDRTLTRRAARGAADLERENEAALVDSGAAIARDEDILAGP